MEYKEWQRVMLTEAKVLAYLRRALRKTLRVLLMRREADDEGKFHIFCSFKFSENARQMG